MGDNIAKAAQSLIINEDLSYNEKQKIINLQNNIENTIKSYIKEFQRKLLNGEISITDNRITILADYIHKLTEAANNVNARDITEVIRSEILYMREFESELIDFLRQRQGGGVTPPAADILNAAEARANSIVQNSSIALNLSPTEVTKGAPII